MLRIWFLQGPTSLSKNLTIPKCARSFNTCKEFRLSLVKNNSWKHLHNNGQIHWHTIPICSSYFVGELGEDVKVVLVDTVHLQALNYSSLRLSFQVPALLRAFCGGGETHLSKYCGFNRVEEVVGLVFLYKMKIGIYVLKILFFQAIAYLDLELFIFSSWIHSLSPLTVLIAPFL